MIKGATEFEEKLKKTQIIFVASSSFSHIESSGKFKQIIETLENLIFSISKWMYQIIEHCVMGLIAFDTLSRKFVVRNSNQWSIFKEELIGI